VPFKLIGSMPRYPERSEGETEIPLEIFYFTSMPSLRAS
jgi:hypothetical protein